MKYINITLIAVLIATTVVLWRQIKQLQYENRQMQMQMQTAAALKSVKESAEEKHYELAEVMGRMQRHFDKLWFAGKAGNWPLASFYTHELEESLEELIEAEVSDDGINVSKLADAMTKQPLEELEESVKKEQLPDFEGAYKRMMTTCNQCHQSANHSFIQITISEKPSVGNQKYTP